MPISLLGLAGALGIGISLGLLGSGGSIITVPVLVYLFGQAPKEAVAGSLLVVGVVAMAGALANLWQRRQPAWRTVAVFAPSGMIGAWLGAALSQYVSGTVQLRTFAFAMLVAAALMLRPPAALRQAEAGGGGTTLALPWLLLLGLATGLLTGFVGVGGGFMIVPALVLGARLPMPQAVASSLLLIVLNSATGFAGQWQAGTLQQPGLDYAVLALVAALGIVGTLAGQGVARRLPVARLRQAFGAALVVLAAFLLWQGAPA